ncbi:hypothetical protein GQ473_02935 [archaeon]|nr:hypothetical protein [archaeon]
MKYLLFTTPTCPNCLAIKEFIKNVELKGDFIDASTDDGLKKAVDFNVSSVPTVLFFNNNNKEKIIAEAHNINDIKNAIEKNKD